MAPDAALRAGALTALLSALPASAAAPAELAAVPGDSMAWASDWDWEREAALEASRWARASTAGAGDPEGGSFRAGAAPEDAPRCSGDPAACAPSGLRRRPGAGAPPRGDRPPPR